MMSLQLQHTVPMHPSETQVWFRTLILNWDLKEFGLVLKSFSKPIFRYRYLGSCGSLNETFEKACKSCHKSLTTSGSGSCGRYACSRYLTTGVASSTSRAPNIARRPQAAVVASKLLPFSQGLRHSLPDSVLDQNRVEPGEDINWFD